MHPPLGSSRACLGAFMGCIGVGGGGGATCDGDGLRQRVGQHTTARQGLQRMWGLGLMLRGCKEWQGRRNYTYRHARPTETGGPNPPPTLVQATPMYTIITVPTPTAAWTRAWLAHNTYNCRHTRAQARCAEMGNSGCIRRKRKKILVHQQGATCAEIGKCDDKPMPYVAALDFVHNQITYNYYGPYADCSLDKGVAYTMGGLNGTPASPTALHTACTTLYPTSLYGTPPPSPTALHTACTTLYPTSLYGTPPPLYKLRQCTHLLRSLRLL